MFWLYSYLETKNLIKAKAGAQNSAAWLAARLLSLRSLALCPRWPHWPGDAQNNLTHIELRELSGTLAKNRLSPGKLNPRSSKSIANGFFFFENQHFQYLLPSRWKSTSVGCQRWQVAKSQGPARCQIISAWLQPHRLSAVRYYSSLFCFIGPAKILCQSFYLT